MEQAGKKTAQGEKKAPAKPSDHTQRMRRIAHQRLDQLFDQAATGRFFGRMAIEVSFEGGRPHTIRHQIEGVDKPTIH